MGKYVDGLKILSVYGGSDIVRQLKALRKGVTAVIGTPGRVMDHMRRGTLKLENVKYLVLDEADEMLDMGFRDDIETICQAMPEDRQTALFSATMPDEILELTRAYQKDPEIIEVSHDELTVPKIKQSYYMVKGGQKDEALCRLIDYMCPKRALVFCNTKRKVDQLTLLLKRRGYSAEGLHGDLSQQQRDRVMDLFRSGNLDLLLATDVAARGIDVDDVDIVFNYDLPQEMEYYVHRIGRTGRAGKKGKAVSLINTRERRKINALEEFTGASIKEKVMPSYRDVMPIKANSNIERALKFCEGMDLTEYADMIRSYAMENHTDQLLIAAAFLRESLGEAREDIEIVSGKRGSGKKGSRRNSGRDGNSGRSGRSDRYGKKGRRSGRSDSDFSRDKNKRSRRNSDSDSRDFRKSRNSSSRDFRKSSGRGSGERNDKYGNRERFGRDNSSRKRSGKFVKPGSHSGKGARRGKSSADGFRAFRGKKK
jgi:ATP-dependent RNA helicase DeaD